MNPKIRRLTETAMLLALLICLQWAGSMIPHPTAKQLVTGSCVNCVLAVTVLLTSVPGAVAVALISPVGAFLLGIAPNFITVLPIMAGNSCFVVLLRLLRGWGKQPAWRGAGAVAVAAAVKSFVLYLLVVKLICGVASGALLGKKLADMVLLAPPMLEMLPAMFGWLQLITALVGGGLALAVSDILCKALKR